MKYIFKDSCIGVSIFRQAGAAPTITLVSVGDITDSTANVNVSIADGDDVSKTGVEIDIDATFSNPTSYEENGAVNSVAVDSLTAETTYYVRAYVIWGGQTIYSSNSLNFTTESGSILPIELQACEYLETTDELPYIKLSDISTASITYIKAEIETNNLNNKTLFAARQGSNSLQLFVNQTNKISCRCFGSTAIDSNIGNGRFTAIIDKTNRQFSVDNQNYSITNTYGGINQNIYLFGLYVNIWNGTEMKFRHFETNNCNLYPCYVKSGQTFIDNKGNTCTAGTCGMYDVVNHVFYTNDGTGTFSKGADINI